eukprot:symbB.v1.2.019991.t1/scaffold1654.1/size107508/16
MSPNRFCHRNRSRFGVAFMQVPNGFSNPLPSPVNPVAETPAVEGTARIQDSEASETSAPSEIGKPEGAGRVECSEVVEASAPLDGPPLVASEVAPESAKEEVKEIEEKVSSKALQELDGLKEAIFGLQSELQMLRRDNGALKSALCAQGGALPVEIAVSPTPSAASLLSKERSKSKAEEDELVSAVPAVPAVPALPMPQATSSRQTERRANQGACWQPLFEDCWEPASRQHLEDKKGSSHKELPTHEPPSARVPLSPLATTVGTSTYGGATPSMPASTAASPQMARLPPPREPPMDSSRDGMPTIAGKRTAPMPDSWGRQASVGWRRLDEIDPQPNFLGRRAEEQSSSSWSTLQAQRWTQHQRQKMNRTVQRLPLSPMRNARPLLQHQLRLGFLASRPHRTPCLTP